MLPALFLRPSTPSEASILQQTLSENEEETANIAGFVCSMKDWSQFSIFLSDMSPRIVPLGERFKQKVRIVDPDFHALFTGSQHTKRELLRVKLDGPSVGDISIPGTLGPVPFRRVVEAALGEAKTSIPKALNYANRFYAHIDRMTYGVEKFQIDSGCDIIVSTYVPITSLSIAARQIEKERRLVHDSAIMFNTVFSDSRSSREFMAMIAVNVNILDSEYRDDILDLATQYRVDHVGLKLLGFNDKDPARAFSILRFVEEMRSRLDEQKRTTPIHLFNVMSEFGYAAFCHGASSAAVPIATIPELHFDPNNPASPELKGRYYHPTDMTYDTFEELCAKTATSNFLPPCNCRYCRSVASLLQAEPHWPAFRKSHFVLAKNEEMGEIRRAPMDTMNIHLRDRFARSQATAYLPYLDYMYPSLL